MQPGCVSVPLGYNSRDVWCWHWADVTKEVPSRVLFSKINLPYHHFLSIRSKTEYCKELLIVLALFFVSFIHKWCYYTTIFILVASASLQILGQPLSLKKKWLHSIKHSACTEKTHNLLELIMSPRTPLLSLSTTLYCLLVFQKLEALFSLQRFLSTLMSLQFVLETLSFKLYK